MFLNVCYELTENCWSDNKHLSELELYIIHSLQQNYQNQTVLYIYLFKSLSL